jgi:hypothetical protein
VTSAASTAWRVAREGAQAAAALRGSSGVVSYMVVSSPIAALCSAQKKQNGFTSVLVWEKSGGGKLEVSLARQKNNRR